jgi:hypothetical protein
MIPIFRTIGSDRMLDEMLFCFGELDAELLAPVPNAPVRNHHTPLGHGQINIMPAEAEQMIDSDGMADDLERNATAMVRIGLRRLLRRFANLAPSASRG